MSQAARILERIEDRERHRAALREAEISLDPARLVRRAAEVVDYAFAILYGLIGLEILAEFFGARESNPFKMALDRISEPFLGSFAGLLSEPTFGGVMHISLSYLFALVVYLFVHAAILGGFRLFLRMWAKY